MFYSKELAQFLVYSKYWEIIEWIFWATVGKHNDGADLLRIILAARANISKIMVVKQNRSFFFFFFLLPNQPTWSLYVRGGFSG